MKKRTVILLAVFLCTVVLVSGCQKAAKKPTVPENTADTQIQQTADSDKRLMASRYSNVAMSVGGVQKATVVVSTAESTVPGGTNSPGSANGDVSGLTLPENQMPSNVNPNAIQPNPGNVPGSDTSGLNSPAGDIPNAANNPAANTMAGKMVVMVGLILDPAAMKDEAKVTAIKEEVRSKIMANDQMIREVLVTNDPDMIKKLQDVAAGVIQGKPMQTYAQDVDQLNKTIRGL